MGCGKHSHSQSEDDHLNVLSVFIILAGQYKLGLEVVVRCLRSLRIAVALTCLNSLSGEL